MVFRNSARSILKPTLLVATVLLNSDANGGRVAPNVGRTVAPEASDDFYQASQ
jgi:N-acetylglutamate synthase/N-acetylornithine aminotransferase